MGSKTLSLSSTKIKCWKQLSDRTNLAIERGDKLPLRSFIGPPTCNPFFVRTHLQKRQKHRFRSLVSRKRGDRILRSPDIMAHKNELNRGPSQAVVIARGRLEVTTSMTRVRRRVDW